VLRAEPHVKPDAPTALALRTIAAAATGAALARPPWCSSASRPVATPTAPGRLPPSSSDLRAHGHRARGPGRGRGRAGVQRWRAARRRGCPWTALTVTATLLVASSAVVSHAVARVEWRAPLIALDAAHQVAAALWIGGLRTWCCRRSPTVEQA